MRKGMKITGLILTGIFLFDIGFLAGRYIFKRDVAAEQLNVNNSIESVVDTRQEKNQGILENNAELVFRTHYFDCGHLVEVSSLASEDAGKTEKQLQESYSVWTIMSFNDKRVVLYKEEMGICDNHFLIKEYEGKVVVFYKNTGRIKEVLDIDFKFLGEVDQNFFKNGVELNSNAELSSLKEDYTS